MEAEVDHYSVLGLPSGEESAKLSHQEINKAFRSKARELHPDKRPDDPKAHENFQKLQASYEILKDEKARKLFDDQLKLQREKLKRQEQQDSKRQKMMSHLDRREKYSSIDPELKKQQEELERTSRQLREELQGIQAMQKAKRMSGATASAKKDTSGVGKGNKRGSATDLDTEKILKVSWEKIGHDYTAQALREIFEEFGVVEDVVKRDRKRSALVVMESKDAAVAAVGMVLGDLSNPLLIKPFKPISSPVVSIDEKNELDGPNLSSVVGSGYQAFENSVLEKLRKAAEKQK